MSLGTIFGRLADRRGWLVACLFVAVQFCAASAQAAWWNGDWQYRVKIDADTGPKGANVGAPIGRTQVLVRLLANNFKFDTAKQDGGDLRLLLRAERNRHGESGSWGIQDLPYRK